MLEISPEQAKCLILDIQGLRTQRPYKSILDAAHRIHNIQIDTMSVVSRSHNLTLFNRLPGYKEGEVWSALENKSLFEYWSHAMCLLPVESYPYYALRMKQLESIEGGWWYQWASKNKNLIERVYAFVKENGPTSSSDFKSSGPKGWGGGPESRAMQALHLSGKLLISNREGFQKYYDLPERIMPSNISVEPMTQEEADEFTVLTTLDSLGIGSQKDIRTYMGRFKASKKWGFEKEPLLRYLESLCEADVLKEVKIDGFSERYFTLQRNAFRLKVAEANSFPDQPVKFLSPFDNVVRERHFPQDVWGFDYKLEAYTPPDKRKHGYHVLPILDGTNLVGRVDAKMHRKDGWMELISLYLEDDFWKNEEGMNRLIAGINEFSEFHGADRTEVKRTYPRRARLLLERSL